MLAYLVEDREAQHVGAILAEAALANVQLTVAKAVLQAEYRREGATAEEAVAKAEQAVEKMATELAFGRLPVPATMKRRSRQPQVKVVYFGSLFEADQADGKPILPPADEPVQLAMFAW